MTASLEETELPFLIVFNPFRATDLFRYLLKPSENQSFQGVSKEVSSMKWVNQPLLQNEMEEIEKIFF